MNSNGNYEQTLGIQSVAIFLTTMLLGTFNPTLRILIPTALDISAVLEGLWLFLEVIMIKITSQTL